MVQVRNSILILASSSLLVLSACSGKQERKPQLPLVTVGAVTQGSFSDVIEAVGTAMGNEQVVLTAPVTERITSINFADGGYVQKGQVIATLAQGQEDAALASARAQETVAGQQLSRVQALKDRGFATKANLDTQVAAYNSARAAAAEARASIGDRIVRAPFSGWVSLRTVSPGAVVGAGTEIATVADVSRIKLDFTVAETDLARISPGTPIQVTAAAYPGKPFSGTIATIDPVVDPATRAVRVRAILPNGDRMLKPGMLLQVRILTRQRTALAVPELAVVGEGDKRYVFVAQGDAGKRKAKRVEVKVGARSAGKLEVLSGLRAGDRIVTDGVVKLTDGAPFRLPQDKPPAGAKGADGKGG